MVGILGANSVSGGYEIDNSLRFNKPDTAVLRKTFSGSPTATQKCTFSFWTKLADPSVTTSKTIFSAIKSGSDEDIIQFHGINNGIHGGFELTFNNGNDGVMYIGTGGTTLVRFRDPSAWYHFVIAIDSTQGTASNRVKVYVNGVQNEVESRIDGGAITTDVPLTQNYALGFLTASAHSIGENVESAGTTPYDGYLADFNFIDGTQNAPTDFGETDDNGVWIPIKYTGSYGNYGFFMEFKQTGTGTDASGMGADTSGNDNHFAPTNLAASDVVIDTPTNNFATFNPLIAPPNKATFSEGNLKSVTPATGSQGGLATQGVSTGKWYAEFKYIAKSGDRRVNVGQVRDLSPMSAANTILGDNTTSVGYRSVDGQIWYNSGLTSYGATYDVGDIIGVALDLDNGYIYFSKNNTWQNSGVPTSGATGTGGISNSISIGEFHFIGFSDATGSGSETMTANYGQDSSFAGTETAQNNADGNGYGLFKYTPPSGFYSLCTKNLGEFG